VKKRPPEYWLSHKGEAQEIFDAQVFVPYVKAMAIPKWLKKAIIKYRQLPVVDGVVQGWLVFEMHTTRGLCIDVTEGAASAAGLSVDVADFERRMDEFATVSRAGRKSGLAEGGSGSNRTVQLNAAHRQCAAKVERELDEQLLVVRNDDAEFAKVLHYFVVTWRWLWLEPTRLFRQTLKIVNREAAELFHNWPELDDGKPMHNSARAAVGGAIELMDRLANA